MLGNLVIGTGVLVPAGIINALVSDLAVSVPKAATLIGYGAVVLCLAAPILAFVTNGLDRRHLLTLCLVWFGLGHLASAFAPNFEVLLVIRLLMIGAAAVFTPQAASSIALFVAPERRAGAIAFVFAGWSLSNAVFLPVSSLIASSFGWRAVYEVLGALCLVGAAGVWFTMAGGLRAARMTLASWGEVLTSPPILTILLVTSLQMAGQFTLFPYLVPELQRVADAPPESIALLLATFGASGVIGSMVMARLVGRLGTSTTIALCITNTMLGLLVFALFTRDVPTAFLAISIWGFAFAASNSLQQARLISVSPALSSASVALNSSVLYVGQAIGTAVGAATLTAGHPERLGFHAAAIVLGALCLSLLVARLFRT